MRVEDALTGIARLGLEAAPVIYFLELHPRYGPLVTEISQRIATGSLTGVTSAITLTEVLVRPLLLGDVRLVEAYRHLLLDTRHVETVPVEPAIAEHAAELRACYRLRTPDALQVATALLSGCEAFLTNGAGLRRVTELRILVLDDLEL